MTSYPVTPGQESDMQPWAGSAQSEVSQLAARVAALEARFPTSSWVFGNSFLKRAFALWGHVFVAQLIIAVVIWIIFFACTVAFGGLLATLIQR